MSKPKSRYIPSERTREFWITQNGEMDPTESELWVQIRGDLTFDEVNSMNIDSIERDADGNPVLDKDGNEVRRTVKDDEIWPVMAPFVLDWNLAYRDDSGKVKDLPAPAEGGAESLRRINPKIVGLILSQIRFNSTGAVSVDFLDKSRRTEKPDTATKSSEPTASGRA